MEECASKPLKNFTIPKLRREADKVYALQCHKNKREYSELQNTLNEARLDMGCELQSSWQFGETKMVINRDLEKKFVSKRSEMREDGRHGRELQEHYCFLVLPNSAVQNICSNGLCVDGSFSAALGNPLRGVYLFRHIDVALTYAEQKNDKSNTIFIFKVIFGKIKKIQPVQVGKKKEALDPTPNYDCHVSRNAASPNDTPDKQFIGSLIYLYEYDRDSQPVTKPRHCLPYAYISVIFQAQKPSIVQPLTSLRLKPRLFLDAGKDTLSNCTVAKRIGKGKDATILFESIRTPVLPTPTWNVQHCGHNQSLHLSCMANHQNILGKLLQHSISNIVAVSGIHSSDVCGSEAKFPADEKTNDLESHINSMVITSRSIKDPRLLKRNETLADNERLQKYDTECNPLSEKNVSNSKKFSRYLSFEETRLSEELSEKQRKISAFCEEDQKDKLGSVENSTQVKKAYVSEINKDDRRFIGHSDYPSNETNHPGNNQVLSIEKSVDSITSVSPIKSDGSVKFVLNDLKWEHQLTSVRSFNKVQATETAKNSNCTKHNNYERRVQGSPVRFQEVKSTPKSPQKKTVPDYVDNKHDTESSLSRINKRGLSTEYNKSVDKYKTKRETPNFVKNNINKAQGTPLSNSERTPLIEKNELNVSVEDLKQINESSADFVEKVSANTLMDKNVSAEMYYRQTTNEKPKEYNPTLQKITAEKTGQSYKKSTLATNLQVKSKTKNLGKSSHKKLASHVVSISSGEKRSNVQAPAFVLSDKKMNKNIIKKDNNGGKIQRTEHKPQNPPLFLSENIFEKIQKRDETISRCSTLENDTVICSNSLEKNTKDVETAENVDSGVASSLKEVCSDKFLMENNTDTVNCADDKYNKISNKEEYDVQHICATNMQDLVGKSQYPVIYSLGSEILNQPYDPEDTFLHLEHFGKSLQSKTQIGDPEKMTSETEMLRDIDIFFHSIEVANEIEISSKNPGSENGLTPVHSSCVRNMSDECSCCECGLEKRIDWVSLFGVESAKAAMGLVFSSSMCPGSNSKLYSYKAKKEKEPGGMRLILDLQVTIDNTSNLYTNNNLNGVDYTRICSRDDKGAQKTVENLLDFSGFRKGCRTDDITENVGFQSQNGTVKTTDKECKAHHSHGSVEEAKHSFKILQEKKSMGITQARKMNSKFTYVMAGHRQAQSILKKKITSNKSLLIAKTSGRIKKFSESEENIKSILSLLSDEVPLCKNKRISKKLDRAILHLRKAHKRVQRSLQLVAKGGQKHKIVLSKVADLAQSNLCVTQNLESGEKISSESFNKADDGKIQDGDILRPDLQIERKESSPPSTNRCLDMLSEKTNSKSKNSYSKNEATSPPSLTRKCLSSSDNRIINNPDVCIDQNRVSTFSQSDKENAVPPMNLSVMAIENVDGNTKSNASVEHTESDSNSSVTACSKMSNINSSIGNKDSTTLQELSHHDKDKATVPCDLKSQAETKLGPDRSVSQNRPHQKLDINIKQNKGICSTPIKLGCDKMSSSILQECYKILEYADETDSVKVLVEYQHICNKMLRSYIHSFVKKQQCSFKEVLVDRKSLVEKNINISVKHVLKPQAIDSFLELQIIMEINQFIKNKIRFLEGTPTFRSMLWYDSSLYTELLGGASGYQQQSQLYSAFQNKLKDNAIATLQNHHTHLCELQEIHRTNGSHYVFLKYRREIEECAAILNLGYDQIDFILSVPITCTAHIGDTLDDLESLQKSTLDLLKEYVILPKCDPGKQEHALCLLEIIAAKINVIKSNEYLNTHLTLFGMEHLLFDAAKTLVLNPRTPYGQKKMYPLTKDILLKVNHMALLKLYDIYGTPNKMFVADVKAENKSLERNDLKNVLGVDHQQPVCYVGQIIDQARSAEPVVLKQMILDCRKHLNVRKKYFQISQECDAGELLIKENNVLEAAEKLDKTVVLLKPEAVEAYIDVVMAYETLHFLNCLLASQKKQKRYRGLLWFDTTLLSELLIYQEEIASFLEDDQVDPVEVIDCTISDLKSELEIISDYTESVNYSYGLQIMTRELSELSELKNLISKSKTAIRRYIHISPYIVSVNYGSTPMELDYNYNQFSDFLDLLMAAPKKDLGKMAHTMKIMKTIEFMKGALLKPVKTAFDLLVCQILQNKRKRKQECTKDGQDLVLKTKVESKEMSNNCNADTDFNKTKLDKSPRKRMNSAPHADCGHRSQSCSPKKQKVTVPLAATSPKKPVEKKAEQSNQRMDLVNSNHTHNITQKAAQSTLEANCKSLLQASKEKSNSPKKVKTSHGGSSQAPLTEKKNKSDHVSAEVKTPMTKDGLYAKETSLEHNKSKAVQLKTICSSAKESSTNTSLSDMVVSKDTGAKNQVQLENIKDVHSSLDSKSSSGTSHENKSDVSENAVSQTEDKSVPKKDRILSEHQKKLSAHFVETLSEESDPKMQKKDAPATENKETEGKDGSCSSGQIHQNEQTTSNEWSSHHSQALVPMSSGYSQHPNSAYPWQYSLYFWYQNGNNTSLMAQTYQGSQEAVSCAGPSALSMQNFYTQTQSYPNFMPPPSFPPAGSFCPGMPYNYPIPPPPHQDSSQAQFPYDSTHPGSWPWGYWK